MSLRYPVRIVLLVDVRSAWRNERRPVLQNVGIFSVGGVSLAGGGKSLNAHFVGNRSPLLVCCPYTTCDMFTMASEQAILVYLQLRMK